MSPILKVLAPPSKDFSLYLVANRPSFKNREELFFDKILSAVDGGVTCVQLRDHESHLHEAMGIAVRLKNLLRGIPLFINTRQPFAVYREAHADGVFIEEAACLKQARKRLDRNALIGASAKTVEDNLFLNMTEQADYLSIKVAPSRSTCTKNDHILGIEGLSKACVMSSKPIIAVGGIQWESTAAIYRQLRPCDGIAMAGGIMNEKNPGETAKRIISLRKKILEAL